MNYFMIDIIALSEKLGVESTSMNRVEKESLKALIDYGASNAKSQLLLQQKFTVMGLPINGVNKVKLAAQQCGLDEVVIFPCSINGTIIPCFKMEGGDIAKFCQTIGQPLLKKSDTDVNEDELESLINKYGVILYQKQPT